MKKFLFIILSVSMIPDAFSQYFNATHIGLLMGNRTLNQQNSYNYEARTELFPSVTMTNGYMFNDHWAAGIGVGYEIFDRNLFPLFADIRYTLWGGKLSPFFALKTGYAFSNFKKKHYDYISIPHEPYNVNNAYYKKDGGFMLYPEIGVKVPISDNADFMFTVAYRYQKTKSTVSQDFGQRSKWEHKESLNRLSFGVGIMFR